MNKKWWILGGVLVVLVFLRAMLPSWLLPRINQKLATASEVVEAHIEDLDLAIIRGAYSFQNLTVRSKVDADKREFVRIGELDVSLAWRELFRGRVLVDASIENFFLLGGVSLSKLNSQTGTQDKKDEAKDLTQDLIPFNVTRVLLKEGRIGYVHKQKVYALMDHLEGRITNISNAKYQEVQIPTLLSLKGEFLQHAPVSVTGVMLPFKTPMPMQFRLEAKEVSLQKANPLLLGLVPFSFTSGSMNLYSEFKMENNSLDGYAKPFLKDLQFLQSPDGVKAHKQFFIELGLAAASSLFENKNTQNIAAKVDFSKPENQPVNIQFGQIFSSALKNVYSEPLTEGFDNTVQIKDIEKFQ